MANTEEQQKDKSNEEQISLARFGELMEMTDADSPDC